MDTSLEKICNICKGPQDIELEKINGKRLLYNSVLEMKQFEFKGKNSHTIDLPKQTSGVSNLIINGDWECISLEIGGQIFDKINKISGKNTFEILDNHSCLPFLDSHAIKVIMTGNNYTLQYDIVSIDSDVLSIQQRYFMKQQQYSGEQLLKIGNNKIPLNFNHPIEKLNVITSKKIENVELCIHNEFRYPFNQVNDLEWEFKFVDKTLNFSMLHYVWLLCNNMFENNILHTFATTNHIVCFFNGMAGLAFSK